MPGAFEAASEHLPGETAQRLRDSATAMQRLFGPRAALAHTGWAAVLLTTIADDEETRLALEELARECGTRITQTQGGQS